MQSRAVPKAGVALAFVLALLAASLSALLMYEADPHDVVIPGVPQDGYPGLEPAPDSEAVVSREDAIKATNPGDLPVAGVMLGRYGEGAVEQLRGRLVWLVSFADLDRLGRPRVSGPYRDQSCEWAWHYEHWVVTVDAETGESLGVSTGAVFDPSLPPTYERPDNSDREYCERLQERDFQQPSGTLQFP